MRSSNIFAYILVVFVLVFSVKIYFESDAFNLKCIIADENGKKYCVRDREQVDEAANLLAKCVENMKKLVKHVKRKYPYDVRVKRLVKNFNPRSISETLPTSEHTAYSENKGEKLAFCLARTKHSENLIDENTLTFVYIHELAHITSKSIGHKKEFWDNFKFLLEEAKDVGFYSPVDYKKNNQTYCGMTITDNPYYDM